ncbi:hypothetical protein RIF29_21706 [Crotalaria pallida]|uniref:Uncharacterized protein n=1 Tax=Crotalaria pallida TaxID=3830 RepID=A0AAN9F3E6_CROPI
MKQKKGQHQKQRQTKKIKKKQKEQTRKEWKEFWIDLQNEPTQTQKEVEEANKEEGNSQEWNKMHVEGRGAFNKTAKEVDEINIIDQKCDNQDLIDEDMIARRNARAEFWKLANMRDGLYASEIKAALVKRR